MRNLIRSAVLALGLLPGFAHAQSNAFPQTLPPNTVLGRLSVGAGPIQAIPFLAFANNLPLASGKVWIGSAGNFATPQTLSGDCFISIAGIVICTQAAGNFTVVGSLTVGGAIIDNTSGISLNSPTGGLKGAGTINLAGDYYKNGGIIPESVLPPLTISAFGVVACPTCVLISGTAHGDSAYNIASTDRYVYTNAAFTAARIWTLPAANSLPVGTTIWVQDAQGTVTTTNTLTISRAGADTIDVSNTSLVITGAGGGITFTTDGVSNWGTPIQTASTGGTGQKTLTNHAVLVGAGTSPITQLAVAATGTVLRGATGADPAFGAVNMATDMTGTMLAAQEPAHTGDTTNTAGSLATVTTKTNGVAFAASATTDTTNAANISSGILPTARLSPPKLFVTLSANQSVTDNVSTQVNFDTIGTDSLSGYSVSTHVYTPTIAGWYLVTAKIRCGVVTAITVCAVDVVKTGTAYARASIIPGTTASTDAQVTALVNVNGSSDTISVKAIVAGTGGSDVVQGGSAPFLSTLAATYAGP